jgi:hypothetical protein
MFPDVTEELTATNIPEMITVLMREADRTSEPSVNIHLTTRQYSPEDSKLRSVNGFIDDGDFCDFL